MGFPRQEYWSGLPFSSPGDVPDSGIELLSPVSCIGRQILYHWDSGEYKWYHSLFPWWMLIWICISRSHIYYLNSFLLLETEWISDQWLLSIYLEIHCPLRNHLLQNHQLWEISLDQSTSLSFTQFPHLLVTRNLWDSPEPHSRPCSSVGISNVAVLCLVVSDSLQSYGL